jgi:hypothetical protein
MPLCVTKVYSKDPAKLHDCALVSLWYIVYASYGLEKKGTKIDQLEDFVKLMAKYGKGDTSAFTEKRRWHSEAFTKKTFGKQTTLGGWRAVIKDNIKNVTKNLNPFPPPDLVKFMTDFGNDLIERHNLRVEHRDALTTSSATALEAYIGTMAIPNKEVAVYEEEYQSMREKRLELVESVGEMAVLRNRGPQKDFSPPNGKDQVVTDVKCDWKNFSSSSENVLVKTDTDTYKLSIRASVTDPFKLCFFLVNTLNPTNKRKRELEPSASHPNWNITHMVTTWFALGSTVLTTDLVCIVADYIGKVTLSRGY